MSRRALLTVACTALLTVAASAATGSPAVALEPLATPPAQSAPADPPAPGPGGRAGETPAADRAAGMVFDGLRPGRQGGPCHGTFETSDAPGHPVCTHGPDPAPAGVDVGSERPTAEIVASNEVTSSSAAGEGTIACTDDGVSGNRVQAIYAVASDRVDRYGQIAPSIAQWATVVDGMFSASAAQTGGDRHVRWVTNPDCSLSVLRVVLPPTGDDTVSATVNALQAQGHTRADRKYLVWTDATVYCGIGYIISDDQPGTTNASNGSYAGYARIDSGCWGRSNSLEAHELMHTLGGVQRSAPNATSGYHCTDESDRMCYNDGGATMTYPCPSANEARFDCGNNDYFHTNPTPGSYLATHWNTANSSFLTAGPGAPPATDTTPPPSPTGLVATPGDGTVALAWSAVTASDLAGYRVLRDGAVVATVTAAGFSDPGLTNGVAYSYTVAAFDTAGNTSAPSAPVVTTPQAAPTTSTTTVTGRLAAGTTTASYAFEVAAGLTTATVTVTGTGGKRALAPLATTVTLTVLRADGSVAAQSTGLGIATVAATLTPGIYRWQVTAPARTSYTLTLTRPL